MNNLEEKIKEIEKQLEELKKQLTEENKKDKYKRKRLDYGDYYWFLNNLGEAVMASDYNEDEDNFNYNIGNYFEFEKEAENYKEKLLIEQELKDIAMELNKGEEIDWDNDIQKKYFLEYDFLNSTIVCYKYSTFIKRQGTIYCLNENFKNVAIEKIGKERLTRYLKGELD